MGTPHSKHRSPGQACCLFCREVFDTWHTRQKWHTCAEAVADREAKEAVAKKEAYQRAKKAKKKYKCSGKDRERAIDMRERAELKKGRHLCPDCGKVYTANHYRCDYCWSVIGDTRDLDALLTFESGEKNRRSVSTVVHLSGRYL